MSTKIHAPDYSLIIIVALLLLLGLIMQSSAGTIMAFQKFGDSYFYFKRHLQFFGLGMIALVSLSFIPYQTWRAYIKYFFIASIILLTLVYIPGLGTSYGTISRSWVELGPFHFQPVEFVKLFVILFFAGWIERRGKGIRSLRYGIMPYASAAGIIGALVALQPDLGSMILLGMISFGVLLASDAKVTHLGLITILGLCLLSTALYLAPGRLDRLKTFINPSSGTVGASYHLKQSLIGIGSGKLFGVGLGYSRQKFNYLPEVAGDSIFVIIAEELGFFISAAVVVLFLLVGRRMLRIARASKDQLGRLIATGGAVWIVGQAFVNIGAMLGILPLTGITLPFISYGGSALLVSMAMMGIVINISRQTKQ